MIDFKEKHYRELRNSSLVPIKNELLTLTSEHLSSTYHFEGKLQDKISASNQSFERQEE